MSFSKSYRSGHWSIAFAAATFLALLLGAHAYLVYIIAPETSEWGNQLLRTITGWYLWAAFFPVVLQLARSWNFASQHRIQSVLFHIAAGAAMAALHVIVQVLINDWMLHPDREWTAIQPLIRNQLFIGLFWRFFIYQALLCCSIALDAYQRAKDVEIATTRMEKIGRASCRERAHMKKVC